MGTSQPARVRLSDILPYDGVADVSYSRAVQELSGSLMRHNAVVIELGSEERALMRCGLESARMYFRSGSGGGSNWGKGSKGVYLYKAGRAMEDGELPPPCMADIFTCMGKAARASLSAIARHLRLRSDIFTQLLDDAPLPVNETSSSVLVASYSQSSFKNGQQGVVTGEKPLPNEVIEKGLLTLIASDSTYIQICDPNGHWYLADTGSSPGDLLLVTGKALSHVTAGLRPAVSYRASMDCSKSSTNHGRTTLSYRLMPHNSAVLDCSPIAAAGHVIPQCYVPISVSQFLEDLNSEEDPSARPADRDNSVAGIDFNTEPSLRSVLSDPLSGTFLEDAMLVSCGHSFGGIMLRRVVEISRCLLCNTEIESSNLVPNLAVRAAAAALKQEEERRFLHSPSLQKRKKQVGDPTDPTRRKENGHFDDSFRRGVQYPFSVNEKVVIQGNKRTPVKFVGKEAVITSQCINGWYLVRIIESGESVRLQYRSLRKIPTSQDADRLPTPSFILNLP
uniref:PUB 62/63 C-terminal domain-containing protein n=1 Tax=Kalanchoe fedtschenkoi TaxID=63787 RepID=A0A7N0UIY6_KALFE